MLDPRTNVLSYSIFNFMGKSGKIGANLFESGFRYVAPLGAIVRLGAFLGHLEMRLLSRTLPPRQIKQFICRGAAFEKGAALGGYKTGTGRTVDHEYRHGRPLRGSHRGGHLSGIAKRGNPSTPHPVRIASISAHRKRSS